MASFLLWLAGRFRISRQPFPQYSASVFHRPGIGIIIPCVMSYRRFLKMRHRFGCWHKGLSTVKFHLIISGLMKEQRQFQLCPIAGVA